MADRRQRLAANAAGDWFVDASCIDCDACRQIAPDTFVETGRHAAVARQPAKASEVAAAFRALVACPVGAIGSSKGPPPPSLFPHYLDEGVFYCGYNASSSFGANSFFVVRPSGNFMVDSPRWSRILSREFERRGGISDILLTHQDDVADAARYRARFGARVWIHEAERRAAPFATDFLVGERPQTIRDRLVAIPIPGHTRGSVAFLLEDKFLFTGDSLFWSRARGRLAASRTHCWYSWEVQVKSLERLADYRFEWVLAGHGDRVRLSPLEAKSSLLELTSTSLSRA